MQGLSQLTTAIESAVSVILDGYPWSTTLSADIRRRRGSYLSGVCTLTRQTSLTRSFGGYTLPTRLRAGWHFGTERFESEGEFFRVTIDDAVSR